MLYGDVRPHMLDTPVRGVDTYPCVQHPHILYAPLYLYSTGYLHVLWAKHFLCWWCEGVSACLSGFWCLSVHTLDVHYASSCAFL